MLHALIMAGGGGTRFWPRSRQKKPKQFLRLAGDRTLLQQTFDRIEALIPPERLWIITAQGHQAEIASQLPRVMAEHIIGEPCGRDTAACIGLGAALVARDDPQATVLVTPAGSITVVVGPIWPSPLRSCWNSVSADCSVASLPEIVALPD